MRTNCSKRKADSAVLDCETARGVIPQANSHLICSFCSCRQAISKHGRSLESSTALKQAKSGSSNLPHAPDAKPIQNETSCFRVTLVTGRANGHGHAETPQVQGERWRTEVIAQSLRRGRNDACGSPARRMPVPHPCTFPFPAPASLAVMIAA